LEDLSKGLPYSSVQPGDVVSAPRKAFVIQLELHAESTPEVVLSGWAEELDSGRSTHFASATALVAFLEQALQASDSSTPTRQTKGEE
jgi:hypothetical protein